MYERCTRGCIERNVVPYGRPSLRARASARHRVRLLFFPFTGNRRISSIGVQRQSYLFSSLFISLWRYAERHMLSHKVKVTYRFRLPRSLSKSEMNLFSFIPLFRNAYDFVERSFLTGTTRKYHLTGEKGQCGNSKKKNSPRLYFICFPLPYLASSFNYEKNELARET